MGTQENKINIYKQAFWLAVPMMIQNGITNSVVLVDNLMVGSLGTESMSAVAIAGQLIFIFNLAIMGALSGPSIYCAQYFGQKNKEGFSNVFRLKILICFWVLAAALLIYALAGIPIVNMFLNGSETGISSEQTLNYCLQYINIMLWGLVPFIITQIYASSLREASETTKPMIAGFAAVVIDVVFNYLLIYGKFGFPCMGVKGAALATVISRVVETLVLLIWIFSEKNKNIFVTQALLKLSFRFAGRNIILIKSLPIFLNGFLWSAGITLAFQAYSLRGLEIVAALNISNTLSNLASMLIFAMSNSIGIIIGQTLGASEFDKAKINAIKLTWFNGGLGCILTIIVLALSKTFPNFYETSEQVRNLAQQFIAVSAFWLPLFGLQNALYFILRSGGNTIITLIFDSVFTICVSFPIALLLCKYSSLAIIPIYIIIQSLDILKIIIGYVMVKKGSWIANIAATNQSK